MPSANQFNKTLYLVELRFPPMNPITHATSDPEIFLIWLRDKSTTTQVSYRSTASQFVDFIGKPLADVTLEDLQLWILLTNLTKERYSRI